ncbi:MAG: RdgB/HAM1 family non-canonical purine NTP pyrophosphatase [Methylococcaceae bacterium]|jgi:XTP/dITP diphosphohydrolase
MNRILLASNNPGKLREIRAMLAAHGIAVLAQSDFSISEAEETGLTFIENALIKARHAAAIAGVPVIADDSGLEVDALAGAPGVYSARYAGVGASDADNNALLLSELAGVPLHRRTARFRCVMVYLRHAHDPSPLIAQGVWDGLILDQARGEQGFGYDPLFLLADRDCTSAELQAEEKNRLSHRGKALHSLVAQMLAAEG